MGSQYPKTFAAQWMPDAVRDGAAPPCPAWLPDWRRAHGWVVVGFSLGTVGGVAVGLSPGIELQAILLAAGVAVVGLAHGALDTALAASLKPFLGRAALLVFLLGYCAVALVTLSGWWLAPVVTLSGFLLLSTIHFGLDDTEEMALPPWLLWPARLASGCLVLWLPALLHPGSVAEDFRDVMPPKTPITSDVVFAGAALTGSFCGPVYLLVLGVVALEAVRRRSEAGTRVAARLAALALLAASTPPLVAFGVYFVVWHSWRELAELAGGLNARSPAAGFLRLAQLALAPVVVVLAGAVLLWWVGRGELALAPGLIRTIFIPLSAVAVPHLLLHLLIRNIRKRPDHLLPRGGRDAV